MNTKDIGLTLDNINILVVGDVGTGKSVFASSFPTPGFLFDFDKQASVYRGKDFDYEQYPLTGAGWIKFEQDFNKILAEKKYKTLVIDSLTAMQDVAMERALSLNPSRNEVGGAVWEIHYSLVKNLIEGITRRLISYVGYKVVTAHLSIDKDKLTGMIFAEPLIVGQLSKRLPGYFGEVFYASHRIVNKVPMYALQTVNLGYYNARSNISGKAHLLDDFVPNDFSAILEMAQKRNAIKII